MSRGNGKRTIFHDETDYRGFLILLDEMTERYDVECWLYCVLANHYHLTLRTHLPNLSRAMRYLNGVYAQRWNRRHGHVGHVFQGRFKAQVVEAPGYLSNLCRYIMLNPVRAGLVDDVSRWTWSSYHATAGHVPAPRFLTCAPILEMYGATTRRTQARCFEAHINGGDDMEAEIARLVRDDARLLGSPEFRETFAASAVAASTEVPRRERRAGTPSLDELLSSIGVVSLPEVLRRAHREHLYPMSVLARQLGVSADTVRRLVARADLIKRLPEKTT